MSLYYLHVCSELSPCSGGGEEDAWPLYLDKCHNKTASLMAHSCRAVALLADTHTRHPELAVRNTAG